jgi:hypothetical protein
MTTNAPASFQPRFSGTELILIHSELRSRPAACRGQPRISRGGHELPEVSLGPAMPYPSMPCGWPPLKRPYGCLGRGRLQREGGPAAVFYPLGHPTPYASWQ